MGPLTLLRQALFGMIALIRSVRGYTPWLFFMLLERDVTQEWREGTDSASVQTDDDCAMATPTTEAKIMTEERIMAEEIMCLKV